MISDILAVIEKEWRVLLREDETRQSRSLRILLFVVMGVLFAQVLGPEFGSAWATVGVVCFAGGIMVMPVVPDSFAGERENHTLESLLSTRISDEALLLGKFTAIVVYGWLVSLLVLAAGLALTVVRSGLTLRPMVLATSLVASLLTTGVVAAIGIIASLHAPTVKQATQRLMIIFLGLVALPSALAELVPAAWAAEFATAVPTTITPRLVLLAGGQLVVVNLVLLGILLSLFHRDRLVTR